MSAGHIGADTPVSLTFFRDFAAATKSEEWLIMQALTELITETTAAQKADLPWLKLARFGWSRTEANCLRHNANLLTITGIEADYDGGTKSFNEARETLVSAGVAAILYTSPSHTEDLPRWRILAPLASEHPKEHRDRFMDRLNGLLDGKLAGESWTLSQSYYFGSVNRSPSHRATLIPGRPIDTMDELDATARGKTSQAPSKPRQKRPTERRRRRKRSVRRRHAFRSMTLGLRASSAVCWTSCGGRPSTDKSTSPCCASPPRWAVSRRRRVSPTRKPGSG